jgi:sortase A
VARTRSVEDLSVEELRRLLVEKQRASHQARLEAYRRSGRLVVVEPLPSTPGLEDVHDDLLEDTILQPAGRTKSRRRVWIDRLLLLVEIAAVAGLALIFLNGFNLLSTLNREVSTSLIQPTLTPTALIQAVVLPGGHTPPNIAGGWQPNPAEIPEHLRPLATSLASLPLPTPGPQQAVRIQIAALKVDSPVVQGDGDEQLKKGVGQHVGTPNPGQNGNVVLSAHNDVFGEIFKELDKLRPGDQVVLFSSQRSYTYIVRQTQIVEKTQVEVMNQTPDSIVTLISCYPYWVDNKRIVVTAYLQDQP